MSPPFARLIDRLPPTPDLAEVLHLADDGSLWWREMPVRLKPDLCVRNKWNAHHKGRRAFTTINGKGYASGKVLGVRSAAHAVIFKMVHGYEAIEVDHIDGNKLNNRPTNLRAVDRSLNSRNRALTRLNRSGVVGVHWDKRSSRWVASLYVGGRQKTLGSFRDKQQAVDARKKAETGEGYSPRHGQAASFAN